MGFVPPAIPGITWLGRVQGGTAFGARWHGDDPAIALGLVRAIPRRGGLEFRDSAYCWEPKADATLDDGAMLFVYRSFWGRLWVACGNHGWSSGWHRTAAPPLAAFLHQCRIWHRPDGDPGTSDDLRLFLRASYHPERHHRPMGPHPLRPRRSGRESP